MYYNFNTRQIHIITTSNCNLRCSYCYEDNKHRENVDVRKLKCCLEEDIEFHKGQVNDFLICFHGGEPFMAFYELRELCEWLWKCYPNEKITINITTNGTVLTDQIKDWLTQNRQRLMIVLSIDGLPEIHNRNRCNSFEKIDIDFFKSIYKRPFAKMTVTPDAVEHMFAGYKHLYDMGLYPNLSLASGVDWDESKYLVVFQQELIKFIDFYASHPNIAPSELFDFPFNRMSANSIIVKHRCGIGDSRVAFDVYGNKYPCQTFITNFDKEYNVNEVAEIYDKIEVCNYTEITSECSGCKIEKICSPCYGLNHSCRGDIGSIDNRMCPFIILAAKASSVIYANAISKRDESKWLSIYNDGDIKSIILGIRELHK